MAELYGVFRQDGRSERALFIVDKEGVVQYVDIHDIDDQPDNEELFKALRKLEPDAVIPERSEEAKPAQAVPKGKPKSVIMYCRPGCIDCRLARRFLERYGVAYTEVNVRETPAAAVRVKEWTGGALISPVFDIDGTIVIDFKRSELIEALGLD